MYVALAVIIDLKNAARGQAITEGHIGRKGAISGSKGEINILRGGDDNIGHRVIEESLLVLEVGVDGGEGAVEVRIVHVEGRL